MSARSLGELRAEFLRAREAYVTALVLDGTAPAAICEAVNVRMQEPPPAPGAPKKDWFQRGCEFAWKELTRDD